jgi:hypothetical protein
MNANLMAGVGENSGNKLSQNSSHMRDVMSSKFIRDVVFAK